MPNYHTKYNKERKLSLFTGITNNINFQGHWHNYLLPVVCSIVIVYSASVGCLIRNLAVCGCIAFQLPWSLPMICVVF